MYTVMLRLVLVAVFVFSGLTARESFARSLTIYGPSAGGPWHKDPTKRRLLKQLKGYCLTNPANCVGGWPLPGYGPHSSPTKKAGSGREQPAAIRDAVVLGEYERKRIQEGLVALGHYNGTIDGDFGDNTRSAIRDYQKSIGESQNGALSDRQAKDLMLAGPYYSGLEPGDDRLFEAEFVMDLNQDEVYQVQTLLGEAGYNAGRPDGDVGRRTRGAVADYKAANNLGGPDTPTKMLLARTPARGQSGNRQGRRRRYGRAGKRDRRRWKGQDRRRTCQG